MGPTADEHFDDARIVARLRSEYNHAAEASRLAQHWVAAVWLSQVVVKAKPQGRSRAGRGTARRDSCRVEFPLFGLATGKLNRTRAIHIVVRKLEFRREPIIDGDD